MKNVSSGSRDWVEESFSFMDKVKIPARARKWKREYLYRARVS